MATDFGVNFRPTLFGNNMADNVHNKVGGTRQLKEIMASKRSGPQDFKANELKLKNRITELEGEVASLKRRLDELRKAKNTTVLKREREILHVGLPFGQRNSVTADHLQLHTEMNKKLEELESENASKIKVLQKKFETEMEEVQKNSKGVACSHIEELHFLRARNEELENGNMALTSQNQELMARVDALVTDLSVKETEWCDREEKLSLKLKMSWGEKYKEWMEATEAKIGELQKTNQLLRTYLQKSRPQDRDSTAHDPDLDFLTKTNNCSSSL